MTRYIVTALAVGLLLAADDAKKDKEQLQGSWRPVAAEQGGKAQDDAKDHLLTFDGDTFTVKRGDRLLLKGTFTLDPSRSPKAIDLTVLDGPQKGKKVIGIYRHVLKERLEVCLTDPGSPDAARPKEFVAAGSGVGLIVLERISAPAARPASNRNRKAPAAQASRWPRD